MLGVVGHLPLTASIRLVDCACHGGSDGVGVHVHLAADVACRATDRLDERGLGSQEALLVGVEDAHEGHLGQVEALAEEIDADEDVVLPQSELSKQLHATKRVDLTVEVAHAYAVLLQVGGQILGHAFGEGGHEDAFGSCGAYADLLHEVIDLPLGGFDHHERINEARGPDDLLHELPT